MRTPRHEIAVDLAVSFDDMEKSITVCRYVRPLPHFHGDWQDVVTFTSEEAWYMSEYSKQIIGDGNVAMIAYFWHDMKEGAEH